MSCNDVCAPFDDGSRVIKSDCVLCQSIISGIGCPVNSLLLHGTVALTVEDGVFTARYGLTRVM